MTITTRTKHARQTERLAAVVDGGAPAKVARKRVHHVDEGALLRVPDFREDGMAVFIGEDATVMVEEGTLERLDLLLHVGSIKARSGHMPDEEGIAVFPHDDVLTSPTYRGKNAEAAYAWRLAHDTLLLSA